MLAYRCFDYKDDSISILDVIAYKRNAVLINNTISTILYIITIRSFYINRLIVLVEPAPFRSSEILDRPLSPLRSPVGLLGVSIRIDGVRAVRNAFGPNPNFLGEPLSALLKPSHGIISFPGISSHRQGMIVRP